MMCDGEGLLLDATAERPVSSFASTSMKPSMAKGVPRSIDFEDALPRHPTGKLYTRLLRDRYWREREKKI